LLPGRYVVDSSLHLPDHHGRACSLSFEKFSGETRVKDNGANVAVSDSDALAVLCCERGLDPLGCRLEIPVRISVTTPLFCLTGVSLPLLVPISAAALETSSSTRGCARNQLQQPWLRQHNGLIR
jgi:hypothetical protein